ncbi:hypothetical protein [Flavobacterium fluviale]|uniref:Uncharacterized protein n=1 Tax=Flavobacterium fluviale TaxID=2249356 RepID=A0A344LXU3_9FLAO|nr:hypothetical protein [Flavobacterium fluviale]AXB58735.1 hypothetical protein HYN86_19945 [Flavobacterium fluviale]
MKKLILLFAFASLFSIFSCTPDEYETQPKKNINFSPPADPEPPTPDPDGPGDKGNNPPPAP